MSAHIKSVSTDAWQHVVYDTLRKHDVTQLAQGMFCPATQPSKS